MLAMKILAPLVLICLGGGAVALWQFSKPADTSPANKKDTAHPSLAEPRTLFDESGFALVKMGLPNWSGSASLEEVRDIFTDAGRRQLRGVEERLAQPGLEPSVKLDAYIAKSHLYFYDSEPRKAYEELTRGRAVAEADPALARKYLSNLIYLQGIAGLRMGETDNCVLCQGESSCIFPISPAAVHANKEGSRLAVRHFAEYLQRHPKDLGVRWLLNLAYMTLGEYPDQVPAEFLLPMKLIRSDPEHSIGKFKDISHLVGVNRLNSGGSSIMEDFDNDGLLDIVVTSFDPTTPMALYRNKGDGTFEDRTEAAGLKDQLGGMYCVQTDYDNDGWMDIFVLRGAWLQSPLRPSLLRNNHDGTFIDVTRAANLLEAVNAITAGWADYDNDGHLDLFIGCERGRHRLYHNQGDGTFKEVAETAGITVSGVMCLGSCWGDFDGDGYPDLFINYLHGAPQLYHNNGDGTFTDVAVKRGVVAPTSGFACWFWDYDNDGWLDIYATARQGDLSDVVAGLIGRSQPNETGRLYRNVEGKRFQDMTRQAGLDAPFLSMGCNFADFDNDGYLDFYRGTGWPALSALIPNRMFRNLGGRRFADITIPSGTGHLQKGHGIAAGDWDRDGNIDLFLQMGGAAPGDRFHNVLFQNPGHDNRWLTVKLIGKKTNRAAIGARIKIVTSGSKPLTVYRHVNSGGSFGANPLQQTIGLARAEKAATLEVYWPTSRTTQVFRDVPVNQAIEVTEFASEYRRLDWKRVPLPNASP
jgi:hypothetical protein